MDSMNKKIKISFVGNISSSFIRHDYEMLKDYFDVGIIQLPVKKIGWLKYIFNLFIMIKKSDLTFSWFAGWHSAFAVFFSKFFRKKSLVVVGGYDAAYFPEIRYGAFTNLKEKIPAIFVYKNMDMALVVESSLKDNILKNVKMNKDNIECLATGHDSKYWKAQGQKENIILTVAMAKTMQDIKLKGLDTFVRAARYVEDREFVIIGVKDEAKIYLEGIMGKNIKLIGFLPQNGLLQYYQRAKIYCQLSLDEGLPTALCEAMLCECIPVGSRINGVKTVIGDTGFYVDYGNEKETADIIKKALSQDDDIGKKARERIKKLFNNKKRKEGLQRLVSKMAA